MRNQPAILNEETNKEFPIVTFISSLDLLEEHPDTEPSRISINLLLDYFLIYFNFYESTDPSRFMGNGLNKHLQSMRNLVIKYDYLITDNLLISIRKFYADFIFCGEFLSIEKTVISSIEIPARDITFSENGLHEYMADLAEYESSMGRASKIDIGDLDGTYKVGQIVPIETIIGESAILQVQTYACKKRNSIGEWSLLEEASNFAIYHDWSYYEGLEILKKMVIAGNLENIDDTCLLYINNNGKEFCLGLTREVNRLRFFKRNYKDTPAHIPVGSQFCFKPFAFAIK